MSDRHVTRDAILTYLRADPDPRPLIQICKYMHQMHRVKRGATRECLRRLLGAKAITHPQRGYYQWGRE